MEPKAGLSDLRGLEINLPIKPRERLYKEKPETLAVPEAINEV